MLLPWKSLLGYEEPLATVLEATGGASIALPIAKESAGATYEGLLALGASSL